MMQLYRLNKKLNSKFFISYNLDLSLIIIVFIILLYSILVLWSASNQSIFIFKKKIIQTILGFIIMIFLAYIKPKTYERWAFFLYILFILLLISVFIYGQKINGAKRWLNFFGLLIFQPSEMFKLIIPLMMARFINRNILPLSIVKTIIAFIIILLPVILIGMQPDLGTAMLILISGVFILLLSGIKRKLILTIFITSICFIPILWFFLMHDYQRNRIITLFYPTKDFLGSGYNIMQSKIAIGSGGLYGKGWLLGSQSQLGFLPEKYTDFIFAVLAEEFGFIGVTILLLLYLLLIIRIIFISANTRSTFGRVISSGIMLIIFIYVFANISMVSGVLPVVGVPLPLFSYGGSSTIGVMSGLGIVLSIHMHKKILSREI